MADFPKLTILSDEHIPPPFPPTLGTELSAPLFLNFLFTNISFIALYITIELYIYSLKSPSSYHVDVPSYKEMVIER
jgi:hypothetical protein